MNSKKIIFYCQKESFFPRLNVKSVEGINNERKDYLLAETKRKNSCVLSFFSLVLQLDSLPSEWRSPASRRTCSGSWSVACSSPTWLSTPAILVKNWAGPTRLCCAPSAPTSDSCSWGPRPGRERHPHPRRHIIISALNSLSPQRAAAQLFRPL